jgi:hypothetical protein
MSSVDISGAPRPGSANTASYTLGLAIDAGAVRAAADQQESSATRTAVGINMLERRQHRVDMALCFNLGIHDAQPAAAAQRTQGAI